ncbi:O-antigen translocase [Paradevosia shaoguanensis]|uniref:O-antigen translocase n=1 Tax=Paradevosia shaoguanensis TaxID=1335043 RepID=A0AA41QR21_9HYPH|nr:O-antigen translocase [Paradevosia shaoguanensis]MCF1744280.1 O-antigen translocase [Paradevosia shaoguanensis]MCI0128763.1 O-antigen translocase [Paradevosia shaoguanensis]
MSDTIAAQEPPASKAPSRSYGQILRSTAVIGLSYLVVTLISVVRMKAVALLLGPAGVGLVGIYYLVVDLAGSVAGMGVASSGVRQISEANGSGDRRRIGRTVAAVKGLSAILAVVGGVALAALAVPVAWATFGSDMQAMAVAILGAAVLFKVLGAAPITVLQGLRLTRHLAMANVASVFAGAMATIALIVWLGEKGIAPALVCGFAATFVAAALYARKADVEPVPAGEAIRDQMRPLLRLGFVFMTSALLTTGAAYLIRIIVLHAEGVHAAGLYQSAWGIASLYAGFVLQAMGTDFYPRVTEVASDNVEVNRLVNEQARVSLLLAGPGVIATIALAPVVLAIFYSSAFTDAQALLRWFCLGMMLRVVAWPMGYIVLAKGAERPFFWTEVAAAVVQVGLAALLVPWIGVDGAGLAFVGLYVWHTVIIYFVARGLSGFRWSRGNMVLSLAYVGATLVTMAGCFFLDFWVATGIGAVLAAATGLYSLREVLSLAPEVVPKALRPLVRKVLG